MKSARVQWVSAYEPELWGWNGDEWRQLDAAQPIADDVWRIEYRHQIKRQSDPHEIVVMREVPGFEIEWVER